MITEFSFILKSSSIEGIGVFAIHDIPVGTRISAYELRDRQMLIDDIPEQFLKYCILLNDKQCSCPEYSNRMEIVWYLNHSNQPNVATDFHSLFTILDIKAGD